MFALPGHARDSLALFNQNIPFLHILQGGFPMARPQLAVTLACSLAAFVAGTQVPMAQAESTSNPWVGLDVFSEVYSHIQSRFYREPDQTAAIRGAINGMVGTLDEYSRYLPPEAFESFTDSTEGEFVGVGIQLGGPPEGGAVIQRVIEGGPAFDAGLLAGDVLVRINEVVVEQMHLREIVEQLRGERGQPVDLVIRRSGQDAGPAQTAEGSSEAAGTELSFTVIRDVVQTIAVEEHLLTDTVGSVRVNMFSRGVSEDIRAAIDRLQSESNGDLRGLILDLRGNPGGLVTEAINTSDLFLDEGVIVSTSGRDESQQQTWSAERGNTRFRGPLTVLMDHGSASASEIVAGALQDHARAVIVGTQSYGKGSVQSIIPLADGSGLRLTIALYFTPDGRSIHGDGITPDIQVVEGAGNDADDGLDAFERAAVSILRTHDAAAGR